MIESNNGGNPCINNSGSIDLSANFYIPVSAIVVTLLGVAITVYIFMCEGLRELKEKKKYVEKTVNMLQQIYGKFLLFSTFLSLISLIIGILLSNNIYDNFYTYVIYIISSYLSIGILFWFNFSLVNYNSKIYQRASTEYQKIIDEKKFNMSDDIKEFIKTCSDINLIVEIIISHNSKLLRQVPEKQVLVLILTKILNDDVVADDVVAVADAAELARQYDELLDVFNFVITMIEYIPMNRQDELEKKHVPLELSKNVERVIVENFMKGGLFHDIALVNKIYDKPNFKNTSFDRVLFKRIIFNCAELEGTSFRNCRIENSALKEKYDYKNINFSYARFLDFKFPDKNTKFENCNFSEADFSEQGKVENVDFTGSLLRRINFNECELISISMKMVDGSEGKFHGTKFLDVNLENANLQNSFFSSAKITVKSNENKGSMKYINLIGASMFDVTIQKMCLDNARLEKAKIVNSRLESCNIKEAYCNNASFSGTHFKNVVFDYSQMNNVDLSYAIFNDLSSFKNCIFINALFIKVIAIGTIERKIQFNKAQLINVQIGAGKYCYCDFRNTFFKNTIISSETRFIHCDFTNATISDEENKNIILGNKKDIFVNCKGMSSDWLST
jgi:uncharacterized protein YjbI with pentapeptide repeats